MPKRYLAVICVLFIAGFNCLAPAEYPVVRPERKIPAPDSGRYTIDPEQEKQIVWGLGFEIQSDSIASGNMGLPEATTSIPHDLTAPERKRLADEMLKGFRYCRLAGGLYWRGTDPEGKYLQSRWPEQLHELKELLDWADVEGLSFEYWSPPPFWKANRKYTGRDGSENILRCFGKDFANDPDYHGDTEAFLKDFAEACVRDLKTLENAGFKISMWGLCNEPHVDQFYSSCRFTESQYVQIFKAVAPAVREHNPKIKIIADTGHTWLKFIAPVMKESEYAQYVDALVVHAIGEDSKVVTEIVKNTRKNIEQKLPLFQNEYEYLHGPTSPDRCLNTVQCIMNWYQLAQSPTWFWIHILKPFQNAEASGYSLGFWKPIDPDYAKTHNADKSFGIKAICPRNSDKYRISEIPEELVGLFYVTVERRDGNKPAAEYTFRIDKKVKVYLAVHDRGNPAIPGDWNKTNLKIKWEGRYTDSVYVKTFEKGIVRIPGHNGQDDKGVYGVPNVAFVEDISGETEELQLSDLPEDLHGQTGTVKVEENSFKDLKPGHWTWNPYNWHALVGFLQYMPWDSRVVDAKEDYFDPDMRILAYKRPDGKLVIVLSNRSFKAYTFKIQAGLRNAVFKGYRYTPDQPGRDFMGIEVGELFGPDLAVTVPDLAWEFWVQQ